MYFFVFSVYFLFIFINYLCLSSLKRTFSPLHDDWTWLRWHDDDDNCWLGMIMGGHGVLRWVEFEFDSNAGAGDGDRIGHGFGRGLGWFCGSKLEKRKLWKENWKRKIEKEKIEREKKWKRMHACFKEIKGLEILLMRIKFIIVIKLLFLSKSESKEQRDFERGSRDETRFFEKWKNWENWENWKLEKIREN